MRRRCRPRIRALPRSGGAAARRGMGRAGIAAGEPGGRQWGGRTTLGGGEFTAVIALEQGGAGGAGRRAGTAVRRAMAVAMVLVLVIGRRAVVVTIGLGVPGAVGRHLRRCGRDAGAGGEQYGDETEERAHGGTIASRPYSSLAEMSTLDESEQVGETGSHWRMPAVGETLQAILAARLGLPRAIPLWRRSGCGSRYPFPG